MKLLFSSIMENDSTSARIAQNQRNLLLLLYTDVQLKRLSCFTIVPNIKSSVV